MRMGYNIYNTNQPRKDFAYAVSFFKGQKYDPVQSKVQQSSCKPYHKQTPIDVSKHIKNSFEDFN